MNQRARTAAKYVGVVAGIAIVLAATFAAGRFLATGTYQGADMDYATQDAVRSGKMSPDVMGDAGAGSTGAPVATEDAAPTAPSAQGTATEKMVIKNAGVALRVDDVEATIPRIRALASKFDAEITDLYVDSPSDDPRPLAEGSVGPSSAQVTVRVPAAELDEVMQELASFGTVISESSSANDVTEQYVDLEARLKNLQAEETRLRQFFEQAKDVDDLLAVQSELARVRGEIEAMTAQMTYLERQVARATLTISLSESGPIIDPAGADWGFRQAITDGLRGAVALITTAITAFIAISPLLLVGALVWIVVRSVSARRSARREEAERAPSEESL